MGLPTAICLLCLCLYGTSGDSGKSFTMYRDQVPSSLPAAAEVITGPSRKLSCHAACARRSDCLAFWISPSSCSLYDDYVADPETALHTETGDVFFNIALHKVSVITSAGNGANGGSSNLFPQLALKKDGRVMRWQVRCKDPGVVFLAIWRPVHQLTSTSVTLIVKHRVTVPEGMENQLVTYEVPAAERGLVETGDFVGFHYDDTAPKAIVKIVEDEQTPNGSSIDMCYIVSNRVDSDLPVGAKLTIADSHWQLRRIASIAVYTT